MGAPQKVIGKLGNPKGAIMSYPDDIYNTPYACVLRFSKYNREISYETGSQTPEAAIILPLPLQLAEAFNINHSDFSSPYIAGFIQAAGTLKQSNDIVADLKKMAAENTGVIANKGVEAIGNIINKLGAAVPLGAGAPIQAIGKDLANAGARGAFTGQITNPHLTALFSGVELRGFVCSWNFSPRSAEDSLALNEIFTFIRKAALPSYAFGKIGLNYPLEVQVDFIGNGIEKFVLGTKRSVITDVQINYAADGHPSFYKDGAPTSMQLSITLKETSIRTAEDYTGNYLKNRNQAREE